MRQSSKNLLFFVPLFPLLIAVSGCSLKSYQLLSVQTVVPPTPVVEARTISQGFSDNITWRRDNIYIRSIPVLPPVLLAGHGYVAFVAFSGGPLSAINQLEVLDVNNGDTLWQSERFPDNEAFALSKEKAFVLLDLGMRLNIYDIGGSKEPLNSYNYFREFTQFYMFPAVVDEGENIFVYYRQGNEYLLHGINLEGAKVADPQRIQIPVSGRHPHLLLFHNQLMLIAGMGEYVAVNFETGEELWRIQLGEEITSWPILEDGQLFIPVGTSLRSKLIAVDMETGAPLWETRKEFGSNVVLHRGKLYALRNDAVLVRLDIETGETEEEVPFEPASTDSGTWAYLLASDGERLFVYFGDSQELFALSIR